jgi:hypothetical protein
MRAKFHRDLDRSVLETRLATSRNREDLRKANAPGGDAGNKGKQKLEHQNAVILLIPGSSFFGTAIQ